MPQPRREDLAAAAERDVDPAVGIDDPDLHPGPGRAGGRRELVARHRRVGEREDAAELRAPVGVEEGGVRVSVAERLTQRRRALDVDQAHGAQVGPSPVGMIDERLIHRREDAEMEGRPLLLELAERSTGLEVGHAGEPGVGEERGREREHTAHVAERQRAPPHVLARQPVTLDNRGCRAGHGLVTEPASLRVSARARGVHQDSVIANRDRSGRLVDLSLGHSRAALGELVRPDEALRSRVPEQDARAQRRCVGQRQRSRIGGVGKAWQRGLKERGEVDPVGDQVRRHDHAELGVPGDIGELLDAVPRVDQHGHGPEQGRAEQGLHERGAVRHQDADAIAAPHTEGAKPSRHAGCRGEELGGRQACVGEGEDDVVRRAGGREHEEVAERDDRRRAGAASFVVLVPKFKHLLYHNTRRLSVEHDPALKQMLDERQLRERFA